MQEQVTLFIRALPKEVKAAFKAACAKRGITMTSRIIELMQQDIRNDHAISRSAR